MPSPKIIQLKTQIKPLYLKNSKNLLFHGWHHITFVTKKALKFADSINADKQIVEAAALTHDLGVLDNVVNGRKVDNKLRLKILKKAGFNIENIAKIDKVCMESYTALRNKSISPEGMALSDAETLFKSLPITPIIFTSKYLKQNKVELLDLAIKTTSEQNPLMAKDIYFYTDYAKNKYLKWAKTNLQLWNNVVEALKDKEVNEVLKKAEDLDIL